jgi:amino acid transporter
MIAIVSVDSLRNIPISAQYGFSLLFFYTVAGLGFFFPLAWVSSQLAVRFPNVGGSYLWIEAAFGKTFGYLSIWLQWTYNIIWYPTIFAFISSTLLSLINPDLENNRWIILILCLSLFWSITLIHSFGIRASSWISAISAIIGTLIPMALLIGFAAYWLLSGHPSATPISVSAIIPDTEAIRNVAYFSNVLFSLLGLEVIAMHAGNVDHPEKSYPKAFFLSSIIILSSLTFSSLALCVLIPSNQIQLISGIMDVVNLFFSTQHWPYISGFIGVSVVIGGMGIAASWMIGLARGLHVALKATNAPAFFQKLNKNGVPLNVLFSQGLIYSVLLSAFVLLPNVNSSYWLLSALSAQFALLYYVLLFAAAIKLFRSVPRTHFHSFLGIILPVSAGLVSLAGILVGFVPPMNVGAANVLRYESFMLISLVVFCLIPFLVIRRRHA